jgi:GntR family transcriptional regulator, rspAB operon transcriptional repressor
VSLADHAYLTIRDEILRGQLGPGTALSRRRLARELGMSVVPVTEALRRLADDGLVESRARAGTRVRVPTETDVRELYEVREALESQSARLFASRATAAQRLELRRLAEQMDVLFGRLGAGSQDAAFGFAVHSQHVEFHMRIAQYAGCQILKDMIERNHVLILNWHFDVTARRTPLPPSFHTNLAEEVTSDDPARADAAMRAHVRHGLAEVAGEVRHLTASEWRERRRPPRDADDEATVPVTG